MHTVFADTGGVDAEERAYIEARAQELGAASHVTVDGGPAIWNGFVKPFVWAGEGYQGQYPLLVSDRYLIVEAAIKRCDELGTNSIAHGCTGMGNDQVRFDLGQGARRLRDRRADPRNPEGAHRSRAPTSSISRAARFRRARETEELHDQRKPARPDHVRRRDRSLGSAGRRRARLVRAACGMAGTAFDASIGFRNGEAVALNGEVLPGHELLARLNLDFARYGVGRGMYTGDTTIGLKGRIIFEAPGLIALLTAHRALEEAVLTKPQNRFKPEVSRKWVELVYEGFYHDPLKTDLEAFLASSQAMVNGEVVLRTSGGSVEAVAVKSPHLLTAKGATYAQSADWGVAEAEGFIRLYGMSSTLWAQVNRGK